MSQLDRSKLPIRQELQGVANRTLDGSQPDWEAIGHVDAPDGAPNILVVLIDDAGFGNLQFRRAHRHPELHTVGRGRPRVQRPRGRAVLAHESGPAHRPQQPRRRLRLGGRVLDRLPRLYGVRSRRLHLPEDSAGQRVQHRGVRQGT